MKKTIGMLGIILSLLFLSAELYLLKIIQALERTSGGCFVSAWNYLFESESPCLAAVIITVVVLLYSCYIAFSSKVRE